MHDREGERFRFLRWRAIRWLYSLLGKRAARIVLCVTTLAVTAYPYALQLLNWINHTPSPYVGEIELTQLKPSQASTASAQIAKLSHTNWIDARIPPDASIEWNTPAGMYLASSSIALTVTARDEPNH